MRDIVLRARQLRAIIERIAEISLDDGQALEAVELFPLWDGDGHEYITGDRVRYNNVLYKVLQNHFSQDDWTPDAAPSLFAQVLIPDPDVVPVWVQPDSTNAYMTGDKVHFPTLEDPIYTSLIDNNVWSPSAYPAAWEMEQ